MKVKYDLKAGCVLRMKYLDGKCWAKYCLPDPWIEDRNVVAREDGSSLDRAVQFLIATHRGLLREEVKIWDGWEDWDDLTAWLVRNEGVEVELRREYDHLIFEVRGGPVRRIVQEMMPLADFLRQAVSFLALTDNIFDHKSG